MSGNLTRSRASSAASCSFPWAYPSGHAATNGQEPGAARIDPEQRCAT